MRRYGHDTVERVRELMGPGNPYPPDVPAGGSHDLRRQEAYDWITAHVREGPAGLYGPSRQARIRLQARLPRPDGRLLRVISPIAAGLAVAGLIGGLILARASLFGGPAAGAPAAAAGRMPRFYVTLSLNGRNGTTQADVHASGTGRVLSRVNVPGFFGTNPNIAADHSDRAFLISTTIDRRHAQNGGTFLYRLRVSADGRSATLARLPIRLLPPGSHDVLDGLAVSPDGTSLAVAMQVYQRAGSLTPQGEIRVYPLTGGPAQMWSAPGVVAAPWSPVWTGGGLLTFVWQDHFRGGQWFNTGGSQIRVLDTSAPGRDLLASRVIMQGGGSLGFIQSAAYGPGGSPVFAATYRVTSVGGSGTATVRLAELSAKGTPVKVFAQHAARYSGAVQEGKTVAGCQVAGIDGSGRHVLAECPAGSFGRIDNGVFTPLAHTPGLTGAAW